MCIVHFKKVGSGNESGSLFPIGQGKSNGSDRIRTRIHNTALLDSSCERVVYIPAVDGNGLEKEIVAEREREPAQLHSLPEGGHQQRLQSDTW
jgi:hypothetical protein